MRFDPYSDLHRPPLPEPDRSEIENVVVYFEDAPALPAGDRAPVVMEQRDGAFEPHVLAIPVGTTVEFPNADTIYHNVFSLSKAATFDLGRYPRGVSRSVTFERPGVVKVFCHIHADMSAVVLVLPNRHYAHPDASGRFRIDGVPPGTYTVVGWHERARRVTATVRIESGATAGIHLDIPLSDAEDDGR
jgi:plastocyanin